MTITFTNEEHTLLISVLSTHLAELREEIHRTEDYTYKMNLKHQKTILDTLLSKHFTVDALAEEGVHKQ